MATIRAEDVRIPRHARDAVARHEPVVAGRRRPGTAPEHRPRREAFVEAVLAAFPSIPFDLLTARAHARLWASLC